MKSFPRDLLFNFLLILIITGFFSQLLWPVSKIVATPDFGKSDSWHMSMSTKYILWEKLQDNQLPLWSAKIGAGFPVIGEGQIGAFFLPNLIFYKLFPFVTAYNFTLMLALLTIGVGMFIFLRLLNFLPVAAFFGGITLAFSGIVMTHLTHITLLQGLSLMPIIMAMTQYLILRPNWSIAIAWAFLVSQQLLAGFPQASFITLIFALGFLVWTVRFGKKRQVYLIFSLALVLTIGMSAIQLLPSQEFLSQTINPGGFSLKDASYFSFPVSHLLTFVKPFALGNPKFGTYPPFFDFKGSVFWENSGFIGIIPLIFIVLAGFRKSVKSDQRLKKFFLITLIVSLLLMLGSHSPIYFLFSLWPFSLFRVPSRFIWIFVISLIVLAASGIDALWNKLKTKQGFKIIALMLLSINTLQLAKLWSDYHAFDASHTWFDEPEVIKSINKSDRVLTIGSGQLHNQTFLKSGWQNIQPFVYLRNSLYPNSNVFWDIFHHDASMGRFLRRPSFLDTLLKNNIEISKEVATIGETGQKLVDIFAIDSIVSAYPLKPESEFSLVTQIEGGEGNLFIYRNILTRARVYLTTSTTQVETLAQVEDKINKENFTTQNHTLIEERIPLEVGSKTGTAQIVKDEDSTVIVQVKDNQTQALLVLTDTYYPGWEARIDGLLTKIYPANLRQRAVEVPAGDHEIEFSYKPQSFYRGAIISGVSHTIVFGGLIFSLFRNFKLKKKLRKS